MTDLLAVFATGFATVFAAAFQSRAVNSDNYLLAAVNSFIISMTSASLWTIITNPNTGMEGHLTYGAAGSIAVVSAMYLHKRFVTNRKENIRGKREQQPHG